MKIDFEIESKYGTFRDALYLNDDVVYTEVEIDEMKKKRLNNWIYIVENPPQSNAPEISIDGVLYEEVNVDGRVLLKPVEV